MFTLVQCNDESGRSNMEDLPQPPPLPPQKNCLPALGVNRATQQSNLSLVTRVSLL